MPPLSTRSERVGWYMYDWANSAFPTTVVTVFLDIPVAVDPYPIRTSHLDEVLCNRAPVVPVRIAKPQAELRSRIVSSRPYPIWVPPVYATLYLS